LVLLDLTFYGVRVGAADYPLVIRSTIENDSHAPRSVAVDSSEDLFPVGANRSHFRYSRNPLAVLKAVIHWLVSVVQHFDRTYARQWDPKVTVNRFKSLRVRKLQQ